MQVRTCALTAVQLHNAIPCGIVLPVLPSGGLPDWWWNRVWVWPTGESCDFVVMWLTCSSHVTYMKQSCDLHVTAMWWSWCTASHTHTHTHTHTYTQVIQSTQELLLPDLCNIIVVSRHFKKHCQMKEKWFGTKYTSEGEGQHVVHTHGSYTQCCVSEIICRFKFCEK